MKYELSEDEFLFLQFLSEKKVGVDEFIKYNPPNKVWSQTEKTSLWLRLSESGLIEESDFVETGKGEFGLDSAFKYLKLTKEGEALFRSFQNQQNEIERIKQLDSNVKSSTVNANRLATLNVFASVIFGLFVTTATVLTCVREVKKDQRQEHIEERDSLRQLDQLKHDSLYENYLLRKAKEDATFSKKDSTHR